MNCIQAMKASNTMKAMYKRVTENLNTKYNYVKYDPSTDSLKELREDYESCLAIYNKYRGTDGNQYLGSKRHDYMVSVFSNIKRLFTEEEPMSLREFGEMKEDLFPED